MYVCTYIRKYFLLCPSVNCIQLHLVHHYAIVTDPQETMASFGCVTCRFRLAVFRTLGDPRAARSPVLWWCWIRGDSRSEKLGTVNLVNRTARGMRVVGLSFGLLLGEEICLDDAVCER